MIEQGDFGGGTVVFWDFDVDSNRPLTDQLDELKEDMIQVEYPDRDLIIDVGWYPEFSADGNFVVQLIGDQDWGSPLMRLEAPDVSSLRACIRKCVDSAKQPRSEPRSVHH